MSAGNKIWKKGAVLVTGAAGFIGSHLCRRLLAEGATVRGVDCFLPNYSRKIKEANLIDLITNKAFSFFEEDLYCAPIPKLLKDVGYVLHTAALPGVRKSWGQNFGDYIRNNIAATQLLLDACKGTDLVSLVYISSSSVYGDSKKSPLNERMPTQPVSPYGVTKLAGEHLALLYHQSYQIPVKVTRLFTVYGPGQRPDMAFYRFINTITEGKAVDFFGPPTPARDFTYIDDIVDGILACARFGKPGRIFNLGSGTSQPLDKVITILADIMEEELTINQVGHQMGDMLSTHADISRANKELDYQPRVRIEEGLRQQTQWQLGG